jgi:hypothetical protein
MAMTFDSTVGLPSNFCMSFRRLFSYGFYGIATQRCGGMVSQTFVTG